MLGKTQLVQVIRTGRREKGRWIKEDETQKSFIGSWKPANGQTMQLLPEGKRSDEVYKADVDDVSISFTAADAKKQVLGDIIICGGVEYELTLAAKWDNGLIPHWELICTREKEGEI
jgi:hypothetical protein